MSQPWFEADPDKGEGGPPPRPPRPVRPSGGPRPPRGPVLPTVVILMVLAGVISFLAGLWTNLLWFDSVGFRSVFTTKLGSQIVLFIVAAVIVGGLVWSSLYIGHRSRPLFIPSTPAQHALEQYRRAIEPMRKLAMIAVPAFLAMLAATTAAAQWDIFQLWRNGSDFGTKDPQFGQDIGFFVFTLPWIQFVIGFVTMALIMALLAALFTHYIYGGLQLPGRGASTRAAFIHIGVLGALLMLTRAAAYWFGRYAVSFENKTLLTGISYKDANAVLPTKSILAVAALICAGLFVASIWTRTWRLPLVSIGLLTVLSVVVGGIYPAIIQSLKVKPSEQSLEAPFITRNINATRAAFGLGDVKTTEYAATTTAKADQLRADSASLPGVRLIDPNVISPSFRQSEAPRSFYSFPDTLDVDRYAVDGKTADAVVAARELSLDGVPTGQRNWVNDHTFYTHGYGLVAAYGNQRTAKGDPVFFQSGFGDKDPAGKAYEPRIYFGEESPAYSIVGAPEGVAPREFDYPSGADAQAKNTYAGSGGVAVGSFVRKAAYAIKYREPNFILSDALNAESRILDHRTPKERVEMVAPWLTMDGNIYPAIVDGRIKWIVDGYTTSATYPNSRLVDSTAATSDSVTANSSVVTAVAGGQINYIRNSVKATVDAYDGSVSLYAWDESDPVLKAWMKTFPGTVQPLSAMSADLISHVRYPQDLLKIQRDIFTRYHITDPAAFFSGNDYWAIPKDPTHATQDQPPYYQSIAMPDQKAASFSVTSTFVPTGSTREILRGFLSADGDAGTQAGVKGGDYGTLRLLELPPAAAVNGPGQVENQIENSTAASQNPSERLNLRQFIAQNRGSGAQFTFGNLLTLPVGGGLLYVQPLYVQASKETGSYPQNVATVAVFGNTVGWGDTLEQALDGVFGKGSATGTTTPPPTTDAGGDTTPPPPATGAGGNAAAAAALAAAQTAYADGQKALAAGDFAAYGAAQKRLEAAIKQAQDALAAGAAGAAVTPAPSATPTP